MSGRVVVITGASSGIGASLASQLGRRGDSIVLAARRETLLRQVASEAGDALVVVTDATKRADVDRLRDEALRKFGHVDVWVNNAGRSINKRVENLSEDDIPRTIDVVLKSVIYGMQSILPHLRKEAGPYHQRVLVLGSSPAPLLSFNIQCGQERGERSKRQPEDGSQS